jgi:hypothetical protein
MEKRGTANKFQTQNIYANEYGKPAVFIRVHTNTIYSSSESTPCIGLRMLSTLAVLTELSSRWILFVLPVLTLFPLELCDWSPGATTKRTDLVFFIVFALIEVLEDAARAAAMSASISSLNALASPSSSLSGPPCSSFSLASFIC